MLPTESKENFSGYFLKLSAFAFDLPEIMDLPKLNCNVSG